MTQTIPAADPLETYESVPAVSFHKDNGGFGKGEWAQLTVRDWPQLIEQRDDDGEVERWDNGDPKMVLVVPVTMPDGEQRNLWAKKTGKKAVYSIYQRLAQAQKKVREETGDSSYRLGPGDKVAVQYEGDDMNVAPKKGNRPKMFKAVIKPGQRPATSADPFADNDAPADSSPFADVPASTTPAPTSSPGGDPFGAATPDEGDEPPFAHRTGFDLDILRGDGVFA